MSQILRRSAALQRPVAFESNNAMHMYDSVVRRSDWALALFRKERRMMYAALKATQDPHARRVWKAPVPTSVAESVLAREDDRDHATGFHRLHDVNIPEGYDSAVRFPHGSFVEKFVGKASPPKPMTMAQYRDAAFDSTANIHYSRQQFNIEPLPQRSTLQYFQRHYKPEKTKAYWTYTDPIMPYADDKRLKSMWWFGLMPNACRRDTKSKMYSIFTGHWQGTGARMASRRKFPPKRHAAHPV